MTQALKKIFWGVFTAGATLSIGFLSFAGMFALSSSLILCCAAFTLAVAYEGQVNGEGIAQAFERMFDSNYLNLGIVRCFLNDKENVEHNAFLKNI